MSIETTEATDVQALGRDLGDAIATLSEYEAFEEAKAAVEADEEVQALITDFEQQRQAFMIARQTGEATQEDVEGLKAAESDLQRNPTMTDFLAAREELSARLEDVNRAISEPLAVDFGGEAGGCCQD